MQQFNKTLLEKYLIPLIEEITTDMGKGEKNLYLRKILFNEAFNATDKKDFINDYFISAGRQSAKKPFSANTDEDKKFHEKFLQEFSGAFTTRNRLSGQGGAGKAYLPDDKQQFNAEVSRNIYKLAYRLSLNFEKARIKELIEKKKAAATTTEEKNKLDQDLELLENGKLKLIEVNGEEQYVTEDQVKEYAANPALANVKVAPMIGVGVGEEAMGKKQAVPPGGAVPGDAGKPAVQQPGAPKPGAPQQGAAAAQPVAGQPQAIAGAEAPSESVSFSQLKDDFKASQLASMEVLLEENGLQITKDLAFDELTGKIVGEVQDSTGQRLKISIDPNIKDEERNKEGKRKFEFTFIGGETPDGKSLDGVSFDFGKADLKKFNEGGHPHSAYEVGLPQISSKLGEPNAGLPQKEKLGVRGYVPAALVEVAGAKEQSAGPVSLEVEGKNFPAALAKVTEGKPFGAPPLKTGEVPREIAGMGKQQVRDRTGVFKMVMPQKAKLPPRVGAPQPPEQPRMAAAQPPLFAGRVRPARAAAPAQKPKMPGLAKAAIGAAIGIPGSALAGAGAGALFAPPEKITQAISLVLHCFGLSCFS